MSDANPRWKQRPAGSTWGDFGPDDQLGRLNLLTPAKVRQGVAEVHEGLRFSLSLPLDYPGGSALNPNRKPPVLRPCSARAWSTSTACSAIWSPAAPMCCPTTWPCCRCSTPPSGMAWPMRARLFDANGDGVPEPLYYNGYAAGRDVLGPLLVRDTGMPTPESSGSTSCAKALGIEGMAQNGVQGRGVMMDLHAHYGDARTLIGYDEWMLVIEADRLEIEPGDMLCLHTGFAQAVLAMQKNPDPVVLNNRCAVLNGRDEKLLQWISDSQIAVIAADNYAVEAHPALPGADCCTALPLHEHCLFKLGLHLGELWHLTPLAQWLRAHGRSRFLLTAPPLNLPGAIASPVTPIATV